MFLRRKPNKFGTTCVQVIDKRNGKYIVLQSFGSAKDETSIKIIESKARQWMDDRRGPQLSFANERDEIVETFVGGINNSQMQVFGPELVYGTLYDHIGYGKLDNELFRHLVICCLFNPGSKLKTIDYQERYLHVHVKKDKVYRLMDEPYLHPNELWVTHRCNNSQHCIQMLWWQTWKGAML